MAGTQSELQERIDGFHRIIAESSNQYVKSWKEKGGAVVGHFCSYVPVELLSAAGILALRLRGTGSRDSGSADVFLSSRTCTYVRHTISMALEGAFDFLDGEICLNTCDHVRRAADVWRHKTDVAYHGFISVPRNARESLYPYYREEVERLKTSLEGHFDCTITASDLESAIRDHNAVRKRLERIDGFRALDNPVITGTDSLAITISSLVMPPSDFVQEADGLLTVLEAAEPSGDPPRARFLLAGTELDEPEFVSVLESQGAIVVADALCFGSRAHTTRVDEGTEDPLEAICRRYFFKVSCARMIHNFPDRLAALLESVKGCRIDGVVFQRLKFCDPWGGEAHNLRHRLKELGIPFLFLEREYGRLNAGQVRTRVQAFHELIESAERRKGRTG